MTFKEQRFKQIASNPNNADLVKASDEFFLETVKARYSYNFDWLGFPVIQYPQDLVALQEIKIETKPNLIIETGFARGGSSIFFASMQSLVFNDASSNTNVITIDISFNQECLGKVMSSRFGDRIIPIEGSSTDHQIFLKVKELATEFDSVMVFLDSMHTSSHVLQELRLYSKLVSPGNFICVMDTAIGYLPNAMHNDRPWSTNDSPLQAANKFLNENDQYMHRDDIDNKLLVSVARNGYLQRKS